MTLTREELLEIIVEYLKNQFDELGFQSWRYIWTVTDQNEVAWIRVNRSGTNIFAVKVTDDGRMTLSGGVEDYIHDPNARRLRQAMKQHVNRVLSLNPNLRCGSS